MAIVLGPNQYGKAEVRMVYVDRSGPAHVITDVNVTSQLIGDFADTHLTGDNRAVIATDTQKNTVYAMARTGGLTSPEEFALRLARNYVGKYEQVTGARMAVERYSWDRISTSAGPHDHAFAKGTAEARTTVVRKDGDAETVISGLTGLVVLKSTGSEFRGFSDVEYTSLVETDDRILATAVTARWRYIGSAIDRGIDRGIDWDKAFVAARSALLEQFANTHSLSLQQTLFAMGKGALEAVPEMAEIRLSLPNRHHFLVDLDAWGLDNPHQVFYAADRPYGLIEASVLRDDAPVVEGAWDSIAGFI